LNKKGNSSTLFSAINLGQSSHQQGLNVNFNLGQYSLESDFEPYY